MPSKVFPKYVEWEDLWSGPISQRVECYKLYVSAVSEIIFPVSTESCSKWANYNFF